MARRLAPEGAARLVAGGWLPGTLVEQVSRSVVKLLNLEAGDEAPSGPVGFSSPSVRDAVTAGGEAAGRSTAGREAAGQPTVGEFGPAPVMPGAAAFSAPSVSAPAVPAPAAPVDAPPAHVPEPRDAPPVEQSPGRLSVSVAATSTPGESGRGRRLSCTVALAVAGALAAVTVGSVFVFDLLPGSRGNDAGGSSSGAHSPQPGATSSVSPTDDSTAAGGPTGSAVPAGYLGTWEGQGLVLDGALPAGTFRVTVHQAGVGEELGRVRQTDQLGGVCNDVLTLKKVTKQELVTTSVGAKSNHAGCNPVAHTVRLARVGNDLKYMSDSEAEGRPTAQLSKVT